MRHRLGETDEDAVGKAAALRLMGGEFVGGGISRLVYALAGRYPFYDEDSGDDPNYHDCVLKIAHGDVSQNVLEYDTWDRIRYTNLARWFAPVQSITKDGYALIQRRCIPMGVDDEWPVKVPAFFTDIQIANWGWLEGRPVCLDYGLTLLPEKGMTKRMRKFDRR